jgi:hypothetical protein
VLLIVDDQAAETVDLGGMARQQQGGSVELRQDRRAGDAVAGAEPGAIVDRGVGPAGSQRDRLMPDDRGSRVPAGRQFRQLRRREQAERIDTQGHDLDRRVGLRIERIEATGANRNHPARRLWADRRDPAGQNADRRGSPVAVMDPAALCKHDPHRK